MAALAGIPLLPFTATEGYRLVFFGVDLAHNALLLVLAAQLVMQLVPEKWAVAGCVYWSTLVIIGIAHAGSNTGTAALLDASISSLFGACGLLLVLVILPGIAWTRAQALLAGGIALLALSAVVPEVLWIQTQEPLRLAVQLADLPGLTVIAISSTGQLMKAPVKIERPVPLS